MAFIDYYKILGVDKNIAQDDVQAAYRKRVKKFHPDLHPDDPTAKAKFQALNEAYQVISDPEKRKKYDQYGKHWRETDNFGSSQNTHSWSSGNTFEGFDFANMNNSRSNGFSNFFSDLFGSGTFHGGCHSDLRIAGRCSWLFEILGHGSDDTAECDRSFCQGRGNSARGSRTLPALRAAGAFFV